MSVDEAKELYIKLREHINTLPAELPATKSGIELKVLKHLYTPEYAKMAFNLGMIPLTAEQVYKKTKKVGMTLEETSRILDEMLHKGLIEGGTGGGTVNYYALAPLVVGVFEYQLGRLTKEFSLDFEQYMKEALFEANFVKTETKQLRVIPAPDSLKTITIDETHDSPNYVVGKYEDLKKLIDSASNTVSIAECVCRQVKDLVGKECKHSKEVCLQFGAGAHHFMELGVSRQITKEEALEVLIKAQEEGLVIHPTNTTRPYGICCCCGCGCELLSNAKLLDKPAIHYHSNYYAVVKEDLCIGCGVCVKRCHMDAVDIIEVPDGDGTKKISKINLDRCIGCGVCVVKCKEEAIHLVKKKSKTLIPPGKIADMFMQIGKEAGKIKLKHKLQGIKAKLSAK